MMDSSHLALATSAAPASNPEGASPFLRARVMQPRNVALALRLVSDVVRSRHHIPAAMLERILLEADPILTWGGNVLRVEGLSSCCGIYARADIDGAVLDVLDGRPGTTNVDFGGPMRAALGQIRDGDALELEVGRDTVRVTHNATGADESVVERKVTLPVRWLRALVEVQAILSRMQPRFEFPRATAFRFLRSLPRNAPASDVSWVVPNGRSARLGASKRPGAVRVAGLSRLRTLEAGLAFCDRLVVHEDPTTGSSAWRIAGAGIALTVALSPDTWRGFSGEGQVLTHLASPQPHLARVQAALRWQSQITAHDLANDASLAKTEVQSALAWLATRGLVGFDLGPAAWFHRVLPFDLETARELIDREQPRLKSAKKLVETGAVALQKQRGEVAATVQSGDVQHRVHLELGEERCTCPWFAKHQGNRGPCKHVLAVRIVAREEAQ